MNMRMGATTALLALALGTGGCGPSTGSDEAGGSGGAGGGGGGLPSFEATCPSENAIAPYFDPMLPSAGNAAEAWLSFPFPSDHRRTESGTIDMFDFPNPHLESLLTAYLEYVTGTFDGFGLNSPIYVRFNEPLDVEALSTDLADFLADDAPIQLIDITADSPTYGQRVPLRWSYFTVDGEYVPSNTLAVGPAWGFPLRQQTTYALLMTRALESADGDSLQPPRALTELLGGHLPAGCAAPVYDAAVEDTLRENFTPLGELLIAEGFDRAQIALATTFTTQSLTTELEIVKADLASYDTPHVIPGSWEDLGTMQLEFNAAGDVVDYTVLRGHMLSPNYQEGEPPYASLGDGGGFNIVDGEAVPVQWEELLFYLTFPTAAPPVGTCYPIVEYAHGTTGDALSFIMDGTAGRLAARGIAAIGIEQPLHGERWATGSGLTGATLDSALEQYSFNFLNPPAARTIMRQSAVDTFWLTRMLREGFTAPGETPADPEICFDAEHIGFFGHSQGGLSGGVAAALEPDIGAWVFSGTGGGLSITMVERSDTIVNPQVILQAILLPADGEVFTEDHPVIALVQTLAEVTDGLNYAPYWNALEELKPASHVFLTSGVDDDQTPHRTAAAMAVAAHMPVIAPVDVPIPAFEVLGLAPASAPHGSETIAHDRTLGLMQWAEDGSGEDTANHYLVFNRPEAIHASMRFLESFSFESETVLERDPNSTDR